MDETQQANLPTCAACGQVFEWKAAYRAQNTPGSVPYNPPGHGVFRPRAYCPNCGALVAEWRIDRSRDYDEWAWYGANATMNAGKPLPPNPLLMWGKDIPTALLPTIDDHTLAVDKIHELEGSKPQKEPDSTPESIALAQQAGQNLNQGDLAQASRLFEQATAAGLNRRDQGFAWSAVGMYYLWKNGDAEQAFHYCQRGEQTYPGANWQGNYVLSLIYTAAGEPDKARQALADAHRYAGTVWWDGGVDRELQVKLQDWLTRNGQERLRQIVTGAGAGEEAAASRTAADTKTCPKCGQQIKLEAKLCRFCRARFEVITSGYCANCHTVVQAAADGKCPTCHGELVDRQVESKLVEQSGPPAQVVAAGTVVAAAEAAPAAQTAAARSGPASTGRKKKPARGVLTFWQLYFLPNGRIDRKTFFLEGILPVGLLMGLITWVTISAGLAGVGLFTQRVSPTGIIFFVLAWILLMLMVKRLHDLGNSGWTTLIWLVPLIATQAAGIYWQGKTTWVWSLVYVIGMLLFVIHLARCIFIRGNAYINQFGDETDNLRSDASSLTVKETLKRRRLAGLIVIAALLLPLAIFSTTRYLIDRGNLGRGVQAYEQADCAAAIRFFDQVTNTWRLYDFGSLAQRAQATKETCLPFQAAVDEQAAGDYPAALAGFAALALDVPDSILGRAAQGRVTQLFERFQPSELAGVAACDRIIEMKDSGLVPQTELRLPDLYMACAEIYQTSGNGSEGVKMYRQVLVDFADHARASEAEIALLTFPAACEQTVLLANEPAIVARGDFLARYYFSCGQRFEKNNAGSKALDLYRRLLIEYPAHTLAKQAEQALIANSAACGSVESFQNETALADRAELLPRLYYRCGQDYDKKKSYSQAVAMYEAFVKNYPDHSLAGAVNTALARALVNAARAAGAGEISPPQRSGSTGSGETRVVIQNDSPQSLRIVFSGPKSMIVELAACSSCTTYMIQPFSCPEKGPIGRYNLPAGKYDVLVESISDSGVTPYTGDWTLVGGDEYYSCFYILQRFR
jgi:uncharacterized membrane protein YhaH (DUF805 family)/tetratricopeptide (TPR) repeat protein